MKKENKDNNSDYLLEVIKEWEEIPFEEKYKNFPKISDNNKEKKLFTIDEAADIFLGAANEVTTFDNEHDKYNWLLDIVIEFKKQAKNYD